MLRSLPRALPRPRLLAAPLVLLLVAGTSVPAASGGGLASPWQAPVAVPVEVVRPFAAPAEPWAPGHRGVDLASAVGAPIRAAADGVVAFSGLVAGRGVVSLDHAPLGLAGRPTLRTTYEPVSALVREGDPVRRGEVIGRLEPGGSHCLQACLHWGLRDLAAEQDALTSGGPYAGSPVYRDPMALLTRARIRLLPRFDQAPSALGQVGASGPAGAVGKAGPNTPDPQISSRTGPSARPARQDAGTSGRGTELPPGSAALAGLVAVGAAAAAILHRRQPG